MLSVSCSAYQMNWNALHLHMPIHSFLTLTVYCTTNVEKDHTVQFHVLFVSYVFALSHALFKIYFSFSLILSFIL